MSEAGAAGLGLGSATCRMIMTELYPPSSKAAMEIGGSRAVRTTKKRHGEICFG